MAQICRICTHPERAAIENALGEGASYRDIAGRFGVSKDSLLRHSKAHLEWSQADAAAVAVEIKPEPTTGPQSGLLDSAEHTNRDTSNHLQSGGINGDRQIIANEKSGPDKPLVIGGLTLRQMEAVSALMAYNYRLMAIVELLRRG